jgi:hypothetical protein
MLIQIIDRARELIKLGNALFVTPSFSLFLIENISLELFNNDEKYIQAFTEMDDYDVWACIKTWQHHSDKILSTICKDLLNRNLYKVKISNFPIETSFIENIKEALLKKGISKKEIKYFISEGDVSNKGYVSGNETINILTKNRNVIDIADASDLPTIKALSNIVKKYYVCWGKNVSLQ